MIAWRASSGVILIARSANRSGLVVGRYSIRSTESKSAPSSRGTPRKGPRMRARRFQRRSRRRCRHCSGVSGKSCIGVPLTGISTAHLVVGIGMLFERHEAKSLLTMRIAFGLRVPCRLRSAGTRSTGGFHDLKCVRSWGQAWPHGPGPAAPTVRRDRRVGDDVPGRGPRAGAS